MRRVYIPSFFSLLASLLSTVVVCLAQPTAPAAPAVAAAGVGSLSGDLGVDSIGGATYSLGLELPPGTGDLGPALSLLYNSQAADGVLGLGWSLTGLSSITRCGATLPLDGYIGAVSFDARDRFCLDGSRLILVEGSTYGAPGTVYHTEQETWTRVVAEGTCGTGPCSFLATNKDGWRSSRSGTASSVTASSVKGGGQPA